MSYSCPVTTYRQTQKDLPCSKEPCGGPQPQVKFPRGGNLGINAPYWNRIRRNEIAKQRRVPGTEKECPTYRPAIQECCVGEAPSSTQPSGLRLGYNRSLCECAKFINPTYVKIVDGDITKMEWLDGSQQVIFTLLPGDGNVLLSIDKQKELSHPDVTVRVTHTGGTTVFNRVCFDPRAEFYHFLLEDIACGGCQPYEPAPVLE